MAPNDPDSDGLPPAEEPTVLFTVLFSAASIVSFMLPLRPAGDE
jgi:hypothetical protein